VEDTKRDREEGMTKTEPHVRSEATPRVIESTDGLEQSSLDAVRNFLDTLNSMFPDVRDDGPRRKVIDAAFTMVEKLVGASNQAARSIVLATAHALDEFDKNSLKTCSRAKA
jgi:hypothetical protein